MIAISTRQMATLASNSKLCFRQRLLAHIRARHATWCETHDLDALQRFVAMSIAFSQHYDVHEEVNLIRMADIQLAPGFQPRPAGWALYRLTQAGFDETTRVHNFEAALRDPRPPVMVSLQSDLAAWDRGMHG